MPRRNHKVDHSLKYRWGIVGSVLAVGFFLWYANTMGAGRNTDKVEFNANLVRITCPRCEGKSRDNPDISCSLCNQHGFIWVDESRKDLSPDIRVLVDEAKRERDRASQP